MNKYIADTMAIVLRLEQRKMPNKIREKFEQAEKGHTEILIPSIVFAEIGYLSEKKKIDTDLQEVRKYLNTYKTINEYPLTFETVIKAFDISDIPELHDRLIAACGKELNIEIITNDPDMESSGYVKTIWK
ncbi:MAG: PIN domain-containing protein [Bacteroidota bacterium]